MNMKWIRTLGVLVAALILAGALAPQARAGVIQISSMTYQGRLKESGLPVTGVRSVQVRLCENPTGGPCQDPSPFWQNVTVSTGLFRTTFTVPGADLSARSWFLEVVVGPPGFAPATILTPREELTASPYAIYSSSAGFAFFASSAAFASTATALVAGSNPAGVFVATHVFVVNGSSLSIGGTALYGRPGITISSDAGSFAITAVSRSLPANAGVGYSFTAGGGSFSNGANLNLDGTVAAVNTGGSATLSGGSGNGALGGGGSLVLTGGGFASGGSATLSGGSQGSSGASAGDVVVQGGDYTNVNPGGPSGRVTIKGGAGTNTPGGDITLQGGTGSAVGNVILIPGTGVGIGTTNPGIALSLGNTANRTIGLEQSSGGPGNTLTVQAGNGAVGAFSGGGLNLNAGNASGAGGGDIILTAGSGTTSGGIRLVPGLSAGAPYGYVEISGGATGGSHLRSTQTTPPGVVAGGNCGGGVPAIAGTDMAGLVTMNLNAGGNGTCQVVVTFNKQYNGAPKAILLTPFNNTAANVGGFIVPAPTTNGFMIQTVGGAGGNVYQWYYMVIE